ASESEVLGRRSPFSSIQRGLGGLDEQARRELGRRVNEVRRELTEVLEARRAAFRADAEAALLEADRLDLSLPGRRPRTGSLHPLTIVEDGVVRVFLGVGFPGRQ